LEVGSFSTDFSSASLAAGGAALSVGAALGLPVSFGAASPVSFGAAVPEVVELGVDSFDFPVPDVGGVGSEQPARVNVAANNRPKLWQRNFFMVSLLV